MTDPHGGEAHDSWEKGVQFSCPAGRRPRLRLDVPRPEKLG